MNEKLNSQYGQEKVQIEKVETFILDLPTIRPHQLSMTIMQGQAVMLVRIYCSDGTIGIGEGTTIGGLAYGAESPESMQLTVDRYMAPLLIGQSAHHVPALMDRIEKTVRDNRFAKCAVEMALLDALGKRLQLPVSELLGGRRRDRLPVAWTLASGDTAKDIAEAQRMLELKRHNIFKLKIGRRTVKEDVAHVAEIKRALGDQASVRVDVNMAWNDMDARLGVPALAAVGCDLVEQPVPTMAGLKRLRDANYGTAIMADESLTGPRSAFEAASQGAADVFAVKLEQSGGLLAAQQVGAIADAAHIPLYGGTMLEGSVGTAASVQVFSTFRNLAWGTELFGPLLLTEDVMSTPLVYQDFHVLVPDGPGLGVALDEDRLARFRRKA